MFGLLLRLLAWLLPLFAAGCSVTAAPTHQIEFVPIHCPPPVQDATP